MAIFIQANLNRSREAQDLLLQHATELRADLCVISEPARTPQSQQWFLSSNSLAAIYIRDRDRTPCVRLAVKSVNFVVIVYNDLHVVSAYISPNVTFNDFSVFIDDLTDICVSLPGKVIVCGECMWALKSTRYHGAPLPRTLGAILWKNGRPN